MINNINNIELNEKFYNQIIELYSYFTTFDQNVFTYDKFKSIVDNLNDNHKILIYLDKENNIVGAITLIIEQKIIHNGKSVGHIEDFIIKENNRKEGIGSILLQHVIALCKQDNCYKVILDCDLTMENFYIKKGFQKKGNQMGMYF
jgi:glucosamine-phosphate N-acetyltransferase